MKCLKIPTIIPQPLLGKSHYELEARALRKCSIANKTVERRVFSLILNPSNPTPNIRRYKKIHEKDWMEGDIQIYTCTPNSVIF
jgi:hypothetical protein